MRIDQMEFLKKSLERAAFAMHHVKPYANNKERVQNNVLIMALRALMGKTEK